MHQPHAIAVDSRLCIQDLDTNEKFVFTLVHPEAVNTSEDRISAWTPLGTSLLGHEIGDVIEWDAPAGLRRFKVIYVACQQ